MAMLYEHPAFRAYVRAVAPRLLGLVLREIGYVEGTIPRPALWFWSI